MALANGAARLRGQAGSLAVTVLRGRNERKILTLLRDRGPLSSAEIARHCDFSAQTASVITRALQADGLIGFGDPVKGKVGKPSKPVALVAEGAFAFGLRIGRRGVEMSLVDLLGQVRGVERSEYAFPTPGRIDAFVEGAIQTLTRAIPEDRRDRVVGIGVGAPFELWNWLEIVGAPEHEAQAWKDHSYAASFARFTDLPVFVGNDATMACNGERVAGLGREVSDFGYIYIGPLLGGGIVLNGELYEGPGGNAGALGSLPAGGPGAGQINQYGSILHLERTLAEATGKRVSLWGNVAGWDVDRALVQGWIDETATALAQVSVMLASVLDIGDVVVDGSYPRDVAGSVARATEAALTKFDTRGTTPIQIHCGNLGKRAGTLGAAMLPITYAHFLEGTRMRVG
ncbi:ROK family transcriptional regulator [Pseudaestuariivita sp.]|uniref:ROK family transcriptional regulator n=1 Tax=Pseudaestuariivita sp. TaxID=2211669 RepID=UPI00405828EC